MSMEDFSRCTPQEFYRIWERWNEFHEAESRSAWERLRYQGLFSLQPYASKRLKPEDILQFEWEEKARKTEISEGSENSENSESSEKKEIEEEQRRYEAAKKRYGI